LQKYSYDDSKNGGSILNLVLNNPIQFKDINLEKAVRNKVNKKQGILVLKDLMAITKLNLSEKNINNLSGIENIYNLKELDLSCNGISDISPLARLSNLTKINLFINIITDLSPLMYHNDLREFDIRWYKVPLEQLFLFKLRGININCDS
jgi:internalin A